VDCVTAAGGCNGGNYGPAFSYAEKNKLVLETELPYTAKDGTCNTAAMAATGLVQLSGYESVTSKSITQFKAALDKQPVGIAIEASGTSFQQYKRGILSKNCGQSLDHAVTAVGYGSNRKDGSGKDYVLVRNSWGKTWGLKGYIKIALNDKDICGMMIQPFYPTV